MSIFSPYIVREQSPKKLVLGSGSARRVVISALLRFFPLVLLASAIAYPMLLRGTGIPVHSKYNERRDAVTAELEQVMGITIERK